MIYPFEEQTDKRTTSTSYTTVTIGADSLRNGHYGRTNYVIYQNDS